MFYLKIHSFCGTEVDFFCVFNVVILWQTSTQQEQTEEKAVTTPEACEEEEKSQTGRGDIRLFL